MSTEYSADTAPFHVVINHEEQYSIWRSGQPLPLGWSLVGEARTRSECLAYIEEVWKDMRPLSLRIQMK